MDPAIELKKRVLRFLKEREDISPSGFGRAVAKNPNLVARIKSGAIGLKTIRDVNKYLDKHEVAQP